jgi:hypothetical protein
VRGLRNFLLRKLVVAEEVFVLVLVPLLEVDIPILLLLLLLLAVLPLDKIDGGIIEFDFLFMSFSKLGLE